MRVFELLQSAPSNDGLKGIRGTPPGWWGRSPRFRWTFYRDSRARHYAKLKILKGRIFWDGTPDPAHPPTGAAVWYRIREDGHNGVPNA